MAIDFFSQVVKEHYIDNYLKLLHYYKLVEEPVAITYFTASLNNSTLNDGMFQGGTYQLIGPKSSLKYNIIYQYPLAMITPYNRSSNAQEFGIYNETEIEALFVALDTCKLIPKVNLDLIMFEFNVDRPELKMYNPLWNVANKEILPIHKQETLYKIKLVNSGFTLGNLLAYYDKQVINEYVFDKYSTKIYPLSIYNFRDDLRNNIKSNIEKINITAYKKTYLQNLNIAGIETYAKIDNPSALMDYSKYDYLRDNDFIFGEFGQLIDNVVDESVENQVYTEDM